MIKEYSCSFGFLVVCLGYFFPVNDVFSEQNFSYLEKEVSRPANIIIEKLIVNHAIVGFSWIDLPINKLLLIKTSKEQCALKYISYSRGNNKKKASVSSSGEESFYAKAEFTRFVDGKPSKIEHVEFSKVAPVGIGKIAYDSSNDVIECGKERLLWQFPTTIITLSLDSNIYMAISELEDFKLVNFDETELNWHSFNGERTIQIFKMN